MKWYASQVKQPDGKWVRGYACRINADNIWVAKYLLSGNADRKRAQVNRYIVNFGSRTNPVFAIRNMGEVKRIKA